MLLGSAYGKVELDSSGVTKGVNTSISGLQNLAGIGGKVGSAMTNLGNKMTIGLTLPILAAGVASVKAASDFEETRNKIAVVFGDMSKSVMDWSQSSARAMGLSRQQALEAAGTFGNLFTSMGLAPKASADMSEGLVQLAADLASFNNLDPSEVLMKLRSGLVGEVEPLRTLGVNLTANAVRAKAMEMGLAGANGEISQAALLQARYALILEQTKNAQGDFARTSDGLANSMRTMKAEFQDALVMMGQNFLPIALKVVHGINAMLEAFNKMTPGQQKVVIAFLGLIALAGPLLSFLGTIISIISGIASFVSVLGGLGITVGGVATLITGTLIPAIGAIIAAIAPVALPILAIIAVLGLLYLAWKKNFLGIGDIINHSIQGWIWIFQGLRNFIVNVFKNIDWAALGKSILWGLANGLLLGIPQLILVATQAGASALTAIKNALGIHSPSAKAMKLGEQTGQGYMLGFTRSMDPNAISRMMAKPISQTTNTNQATIVNHFASGVTMRQVQKMIDMNNDSLMNALTNALGSA